MFVTLDVKFRFPNIKCNLCQNTVKFQTKTSLLDKIFIKYQLSQDLIFKIEYLQVCVAVVISHGYYSLCLHEGQSCTVFKILYEQQ